MTNAKPAPASQPVLIVGAGPVGLMLAYMLVQLQIPVVVLDRHATRLDAPKAHAITSRSLEICRQFGLDPSTLRKKGTPRDDAKWIRFVTSLSGEEVGVLPFFRLEPDVLEITPEIVHNIPQPDFEATILDHIAGRAEIRRGWTWMSSDQNVNGVTSVIQNTYTGEKEEINSSMIVACDGAKSRIVQSLGVTSDIEESEETIMSIHFKANLRPVVKDRTGILYWVMNPLGSGVIIAHDLSGNLVMLHNFDANQHPIASFTPEKCASIVRAAIGDDTPFELLSLLPWRVRRQVADTFYSGRIAWAGDAAHSLPPTGGFGLNSGIADVHNLAFKIAGVYKGWTDVESALSSYDRERQPVAARNARQAVLYGIKVFELVKMFKLLDPDVNRAIAGLEAALKDPRERKAIEDEVEAQRDQFNSMNMHLGYVYEDNHQIENPEKFVPAYRPGARLSHAWIRTLRSDVIPAQISPVDLSYLGDDMKPYSHRQWQYSTLDLVPGNVFVLFHAAGGIEQAKSLEKALSDNDIAVRRLEVGSDFDFTDVAEDMMAGKKWIESYGLDQGGLVLVRPDQHIAAVCKATNEPEGIVRSVREMRL